MKEKTLTIQDITLTLYKSKRARRISISIKPFVGVRVAVPRLMPFFVAEKFVKSRMDWVKTNLPKAQAHEERQTIFTETSTFPTNHHVLNILRENLDQPKCRIADGKIIVRLPLKADILSEETQTFIRKAIEETWRKEAKAYLPERVEELARQHGLNYKKVAVKNTKTRWGSCSHDNNINLNLHLMRLPEHLIDYVILHELAHTKVKNHSAKFWQLLDELTNNQARALDREMKGFNPRVY